MGLNMSNWTQATLNTVTEKIITGPFGSQLHQSDYVDEGIPVIMPQNIGDRIINMDNIAFVFPEDANRLKRYAVLENDIVYSRRGDIEKHAFITKVTASALCGTGCFLVRANKEKINPCFLSLYLSRPESKKWLVQHAVGSNMPNLNTDILANIPISYPEKKEQKIISEFLNSIYEMININNTINA
jgi:type I restriction enzyme S subunit